MTYFTLPELCHTDTGLVNIPEFKHVASLQHLVYNLLDPIRKLWKRPIHVNSGFRTPEVNKAIGGAKNSQHMAGEACDIAVGDKEQNKQLFNLIIASGLDFDQCIDEKDYTWIHISLKQNGNRKQILHL